MEFLTKFETTQDYEANKLNLSMPNITLTENDGKIHLKYPFFCKLIQNDGTVINIKGSGELTSAMTREYSATTVSANIGDLCTRLGDYTFSYWVPNFTSITISDNVTTIGSNAIWRNSIQKLQIGKNVESLGIYDCTGMNEIRFNGLTPPHEMSWDNIGTNDGNGIIYIPQASTGYEEWFESERQYSYKFRGTWTLVKY